ncbi:Helicase superfamily 1/2 ATP-binding domain DinG/Rad3-type, partial [Arabidopsis suecica]
MASATSKLDSKEEVKQTLNSKNPKNVYQIGGLQVEFPYQPYGTQLAFMSRVISTLDRAQRDGHSHALLESPTGTGKSLSLLCSVLAWQKSYKSRFPYGNLTHSRTQPSDSAASSNVEPPEPAIPTIYYASRTHAQITQVIREYRKTGYRVPMTVLGSRKRYCTNSHVQGKENVDEKCRLLLKDKKNIKCAEFKGVGQILAYPSLQQNGHNGVHDIEDLVKIGKTVTGCPYFASWKMLEVAQLVFCPYSYIIDPVIRGGVNLQGAIIIFDEAHNMEDIAREAGSINLEEDILFKLKNELEQMSENEPEIYESLYIVVEGLISWIGRKKDSLVKRDSEHYFSNWTGDRALKELKEFNISRENFPNLMACFNQAITKSEAAEMDPDKPYLSGISVSTLEELFATLTYFFSRNGSHVLDYEMGLQRSAKRGDNGWTHTFSLWCMNPSVVFKDLADLSLSIILTSGTLSPMNSFSSELGMKFGTCLEAPHVIDPNMQVWAGAISSGPGNYPLNASYKTADAYAFQDALGKSLEEICSIVPGGSLVFFPSYKLMEKLCTRWHETGQWSRLCLKRDFFIEPRGGAKDDFETVLKEYYDSISGKNRSNGRNIRVKKAGSVITEAQDDSKRGSAFLAVCRGKVSEGLDFSDDNARAVIIVGIPFPNLGDILVELKRKYNDTNKSSKKLLGGSEWYCQQAYRALNQAAGRCIRHRFDYGAIIFLDERYRQPRNRASISKWLRQSIKVYDNFEASMEGLRYFFNSVKERVDSKILESHEQNLSPKNQSNEDPEKETSGMTNGISAASPCSSSKNESSSLETGLRSLRSPDQFLKRHVSTSNFGRPPLGAESSVIVTPERYSIGDTRNSTLEAESPLNMSVNSHALKRRKFTTSPIIIDLEEENSNAPDTRPEDHTSFTRRIEFGFPEVDQRVMRISCSLCRSSLGHPENHSYPKCLLTSSSKTYLLSLLKETSGTGSAEMPTSVSVIMTDCSLVNQRLCISSEISKGLGIWSEQDGCVFKTIFCPFCSVPNTCLGVQVMATDSSNVQFMSKILFFADHLEVTNDAASMETTLTHK